MKILQQVEPGIYVLGGDWTNHSVRPNDVLPRIAGSLKNSAWEEVVALFVGISARHNVWCGVSELVLLEELNRKASNNLRFYGAGCTIRHVKKHGLLEIPWRKDWLLLLKFFMPEIVCPTKKLLEKTQSNAPQAK